MNIAELFEFLGERDIRVAITGPARVIINGPPGMLTPDVMNLVRQHKPLLLANLAAPRPEGDAPATGATNERDTHDAHDARAGSSPEPEAPCLEAPTGGSCDSKERCTCASCASCASAKGSGAGSDELPPPLFIDFETRSLASLKNVGGRAYAAHESTQVICAIAKLPDGTWFEWSPADGVPAAVFAAVEGGAVVVAHNAMGFDRHIWNRLGWPEAPWLDSIALARLGGYPASLDALGSSLVGRPKDREGNRLTVSLSRADRRTGKLPHVSDATLNRVMAYCRSDVELLVAAWPSLTAGLAVEPEVRALDAVINERGFAFDAELAQAVIDSEAHFVSDLHEMAPVSPSVLASQKKLKAWLASADLHVPDVRAGTLEALLDDPEVPDDVRRGLVARLASASITSNKLRAALRRLGPDGRVRDSLVYHAAHTGRWSGQGFQPQNLPRGLAKGVDLEATINMVLERDMKSLHAVADSAHLTVGEILASLVRSCIRAPEGKVLAIADYAAIEARALMWLVDDQASVDAFARGDDVYRAMASTLFQVEPQAVTSLQRNVGKVAVLGCGYQMGAARLEPYAGLYNVDWSQLPVTPVHVVEAWRDAHPEVAGHRSGEVYNGHVLRSGGLWRAMEALAMDAVDGRDAGQWQREGDAITFALPSGRKLTYRNARIEDVPNRWGGRKPTVTYDHNGKRVHTFGGKLTENVIQGLCRDLLADALVRLEATGINVVLHVHDEVVAELDAGAEAEQLKVMKAVMETPPDWAADLPLKVEAFTAARYRK